MAKKRRKYRQGIFKPKNPEKYVGDVTNIVYRSSWEAKFFYWCDRNPSVLKWCSEEVIIPYFSTADEKMRRYFLDAAITVRTQSGEIKKMLIEIKPEKQTMPPKISKRKKQETMLQEAYDWRVNQDKWEAAKKFAAKMGAEFIVMTEYDLGIKSR